MRSKINDDVRIGLMLESINNIEAFMAGTNTSEEFQGDKLLCHAVCYNLQCIGESVYRLSREFIAEHADTDWEAIEGLRHVLVHDYYNVNLDMVWNIVRNDLPALKATLSLL